MCREGEVLWGRVCYPFCLSRGELCMFVLSTIGSLEVRTRSHRQRCLVTVVVVDVEKKFYNPGYYMSARGNSLVSASNRKSY